MKRVNEIFYSLQGEGHNVGIPSVFLRFSGCNLKCSFCDTLHEEGVAMTDEDIFAEINRYPQARWVILTGGEPSLQIDSEFIAALKRVTGKKIAIETNGTRPLPPDIDWITVSPKTTESNGHLASLETLGGIKANEIKVVDVGQDIEPYFSISWAGPDTEFYLQPCFVKDKDICTANTQRTVSRVLSDPRWRLSTQTHRLLSIP